MTTTVAENGQRKSTKIDDYVQTGLIAVYIVQKSGQPTLKEIQNTAVTKLGCQLDGRTLSRALKGASRGGRNLISILQHRLPEDQGGSVVDVYSMKDPQRWKAAPEYANFMDLLPRLMNDPEAQRIKDYFDKGETKTKAGDDTTKARRGNDVDDYRSYTVFIRTTDPLLGSQIHCPFTDKARGIETKKSDDKPDMEGIFVVDELTGDRVLTPDCLQGWFITNAGRYGGMPDARGQYIAFDYVHIPKEVKPVQLVLPVNNSRQGAAAPKSYEAIPAGQILRIDFVAPVKGLYTPAQLEKLFHLAGNKPRRGISPARGKRYGHFQVIGFIDHGPLKTDSMSFILDQLPPNLRMKAEVKFGKKPLRTPTEVTEEHYQYMVEAMERLSKVEIKMNAKGGEDANDQLFPSPEAEEDDE